MKQITFDTPTLSNQTASSRFVSLFHFRGMNHSENLIKVNKTSASCGCTTTNVPEEILPNSDFTITLSIDLKGKTGAFSKGVSVEFSNGQVISLTVNGQIK